MNKYKRANYLYPIGKYANEMLMVAFRTEFRERAGEGALPGQTRAGNGQIGADKELSLNCFFPGQ